MNEHYDFFLRIGVDGKDNFDKCQFIDQFANDKGVYKDTLHAYVKTTYIQLDDYTIKVEFLITGWNLRPNKNYYSYVDGAMFVCDISDTNEIKELSREYNSHATYKIPIIMIAKEWKKNNDELLNEVKKFVGEEFLFDAISINEWTIGFNKILKECVFRLSGFRDELTPSDDQIKSIMKYATRLYSFEIPSEVIYDKRIQIEELANEGIKSFLSLMRFDLLKKIKPNSIVSELISIVSELINTDDIGNGKRHPAPRPNPNDGKRLQRDLLRGENPDYENRSGYAYYRWYYHYHEDHYYGKIKEGVFKKNENKHVIIATEEFEIAEPLQEQLEKAINDVKILPGKLAEILEHQEVKEYLQKTNQQLKDLNETASKTKNSNMIAFDISSLADLKIEMVLFTEKLKNINLENASPNEINSLINEIDKSLTQWKDYCSKIINYFEDLSKLKDKMKDDLYFFEIQEKLLIKIDKIITELLNYPNKIDGYKLKPKKINLFSFKNNEKDNKKKIDQENKVIHSIFLLTIGLKLVYDLTVELGCVAKRLKLLMPAIDFWKKLTYELKLTEDAVKVFKESELYIEDWCLDYIVKNLSKIICLVNNFYNRKEL